jgi:hypothetical protein
MTRLVAQHEETGRLWEGEETDLPSGYAPIPSHCTMPTHRALIAAARDALRWLDAEPANLVLRDTLRAALAACEGDA